MALTLQPGSRSQQRQKTRTTMLKGRLGAVQPQQAHPLCVTWASWTPNPSSFHTTHVFRATLVPSQTLPTVPRTLHHSPGSGTIPPQQRRRCTGHRQRQRSMYMPCIQRTTLILLTITILWITLHRRSGSSRCSLPDADAPMEGILGGENLATTSLFWETWSCVWVARSNGATMYWCY